MGLLGATTGALGGHFAGVSGRIIGYRTAWALAGLFFGGCMGLFDIPTCRCGPGAHSESTPLDLLLIVISALIGGLIGLGIGNALHSRRSSWPGVQRLAAVIHDGHPPRSTPGSERAASELAPAGAPEGRGDEAAPVQMHGDPRAPGRLAMQRLPTADAALATPALKPTGPHRSKLCSCFSTCCRRRWTSAQ